MVFSRIKNVLLSILRGYFEASVSDAIKLEYIEYENLFLLLLFGSFVGLPSPPLTLTLRLLPHLVEELRILEDRSRRSRDMISDLVSSLGLEL